MAQPRIIGTPSNDSVWNAINKNVGMLGKISRDEKLRRIKVQEKETLAQQKATTREKTVQDAIRKMVLQSVVSGKGQYGGDLSQVLGGEQIDYEQYSPQTQGKDLTPKSYEMLRGMSETDSEREISESLKAYPGKELDLPSEEIKRSMIEEKSQQKMQPYREQFKQQYRPKVFKGQAKKSVTGKVIVKKGGKEYRLPRSQLKAAIKQGYTLVD